MMRYGAFLKGTILVQICAIGYCIYQGWPQRGWRRSLVRLGQHAFNNVRVLRTKYFYLINNSG
jgi:hypothetical protein